MALHEIVTVPDKLLREISSPVKDITSQTQDPLDDMLETMYHAPGIGLAGIQIGIKERIVVVDISKDDEKKDPLFLINPKITAYSEEENEYDEGCLSIPSYFAPIMRPEAINVTYLDRDGKEHKREFDDMLARVIRHEVDHLDGKLFIDYLSKLKQNMAIKKVKKFISAS